MEDKKDKLIAELIRVNNELKAMVNKLEEEVKTLRRRLDLDSNNSSKPPSSDGLKKKNTIPSSQLNNLLKIKGRKKHNPKPLEQVTTPDKIIIHEPEICSSCSESLGDIASDKHEKRQVFDLPEAIKLEVTEHQLCRKICKCGQKNYGAAPSYVTGHTQYGANLGAYIIYLNAIHMMPYNRIVELVEHLFSAKLSEQTVIDYINKYGAVCKGSKEIIDEQIRKAEVSYHDETGARVAGKLHWAMLAASDSWVKYWVHPKRGDVMKGLTNVMSRDGFKPYDSYNPEARMALCNAHILRELEAANLLDQQDWASKMQRILLLMNHAKNRYQKRKLEIPNKIHKGLIAHYDKILIEAFCALESSKKHPPLLMRLINRKPDIIRFFNEENVPFTNNYAERLLRMFKVKLKVSGCFRKLPCAENFMDIRSVLMTLKQQGGNLVQSIKLALTEESISFPALAQN